MAAETLISLAVSLDGFLANEEGSVGWLDPFNTEEMDFPGLFATLGVVLMGRRTFDQAITFGAWPYKGMRSIVLTHRPFTPDLPEVEVQDGDLGTLIAALRGTSQGHIWIMGGAAVMQEALRRDLVDQFEFNWIPVTLGRGIPLFAPLPDLQAWNLVEHQAYGNGILRARYRRKG